MVKNNCSKFLCWLPLQACMCDCERWTFKTITFLAHFSICFFMLPHIKCGSYFFLHYSLPSHARNSTNSSVDVRSLKWIVFLSFPLSTYKYLYTFASCAPILQSLCFDKASICWPSHEHRNVLISTWTCYFLSPWLDSVVQRCAVSFFLMFHMYEPPKKHSFSSVEGTLAIHKKIRTFRDANQKVR